jgi:hypothetical protein
MKASVQNFVANCAICKQAKPDRFKYPGFLQPLPIPDGAWQVILVDFVEGLPRSAGMNAILVVVDKFSKYNHFLAIAHPFAALALLGCLCPTSTSFMECHLPSFLTETKFSSVSCGKAYSSWLVFPSK